MKLFLIGFFCGACTLGVAVFIATSSESSGSATTSLTTSPATSPVNFSSTVLENLVAENSALRSQLLELRGKTSTPNPASTNAAEESSHQDPKAITADILATQQQLSELRDFIRSNPQADVSSITRQNFEREPVDGAWASDYQLKLSNYLKTNPAFADFTAQSIECRTQRCRVYIAVVDPQQANQISQNILNNILVNKEGIAKKIIFEQDPAQALLSFYIAKNDDQHLLQ